MWKISVGFFALVVVVSAYESTAVERCLYFDGPLPLNTHIEGCTTMPCLLPQLQNVVLHIIFKAPHTIRSMKTLARAFLIGNLGLDHGLGAQEVTCNHLTNTYCPLLKDEVVEYTLTMCIEPTFFVGVAVTVEFRIVDENDYEVVCIRAPLRIVAPIPSADGNITSCFTG